MTTYRSNEESKVPMFIRAHYFILRKDLSRYFHVTHFKHVIRMINIPFQVRGFDFLNILGTDIKKILLYKGCQ